MTEKIFPADVDALYDVTGFLEELLEEYDIPVKTMMHINLCIEELFVNVANYAYDGKEGTVRIAAEADENGLTVTLADSGKPFDPRGAKDPDIALPAKDSSIGGYGIFLVKKLTDEFAYERTEKENITTMKINY